MIYNDGDLVRKTILLIEIKDPKFKKWFAS